MSTSDFTVGGSRRGHPQPRGSHLSLSASITSHPLAALSHLLTSFPGEKKIVTHLLCVCLNKIYILLSFLFSFFHVSSLILHIKAPWQGPADEMPPSLKLAGTWGSLGRKLSREGGGRRAGRQATGLRRVAGPTCSVWLFGWSLGLSWDESFPRIPRALLPLSLFYWADNSWGLLKDPWAGELPLLGAHLPLGTLLFPPPRGREESGGQRSEEARRSNFEAVLLP